VLRRRKSKSTKTVDETPARGTYVRPKADLERAAAAMSDVEQRFASTPWWQYRRIDREHRSRTLSTPGWFPDWHLIQPADVGRIAELSAKPVTAGALLSMHPNGYVREAAVHVLSQSGQPDALPFLIIRGADWVEQVRQPAQEAVPALLEVASADQLLRAAALLDTMSASEARASGFSAVVRSQLATHFDTTDLLDALTHPDPHVRRLTAEILVERGEAESVLDRALEQRDVVSARIIGNAALDHAAQPEATLGKLWGSRFASLRAVALYRYQSSESPGAMTASEAGLLDRSPSVRYLAQRYLARNDVDVRGRYLDALADNAVAVQGLAEVGSADDADIIEPLLVDSRPRMRVVAVLALGRLLDATSRPTMFTMLDDPSPSVVRAAGRVLARQQLSEAELDDLWRRATAADAHDALKRSAFVVFGQQGRWPKLVLACRVLANPDEDFQTSGELMLRSLLSSWNRTSTNPTSAQLDELRQSGPEAGDRIESLATARELVGLLKQYGIGHA